MRPITTYRIAGLVYLLVIAFIHNSVAQCPERTGACQSVYLLPIAHKAKEPHIIKLKEAMSTRLEKTLITVQGCHVVSQNMALIRQALDAEIGNQTLYYEASQNKVLREKIAGIVKRRAGSEARSFIIASIISEGEQSYRFVADFINISDNIGGKEAVVEYSFAYNDDDKPNHVLDGLERATLLALGQWVALPVKLYPLSFTEGIDINSQVSIVYADTTGIGTSGQVLLYFTRDDIVGKDSLSISLESDEVNAHHVIPLSLSGCTLPAVRLQLYPRYPLRIRHRVSPSPRSCDQLEIAAVRYNGMARTYQALPYYTIDGSVITIELPRDFSYSKGISYTLKREGYTDEPLHLKALYADTTLYTTFSRRPGYWIKYLLPGAMQIDRGQTAKGIGLATVTTLCLTGYAIKRSDYARHKRQSEEFNNLSTKAQYKALADDDKRAANAFLLLGGAAFLYHLADVAFLSNCKRSPSTNPLSINLPAEQIGLAITYSF